MAVTKDKRTGKWICRFQFEGKEHWKRGFETKGKAQDWEREERYRLKYPEEFEPKPELITFSQVASKYLDTHSKEHDQPNTYRQKLFVLKSFVDYIECDKPAEKVTPEDIQDYLHARKKVNDGDEEFIKRYPKLLKSKMADGAKTANRDLRILNSLYSWCTRQAIFTYNPCAGIPKYPEDPTPRYVPSIADMSKVRLAASGEWSDLIECLYHTAGRLSEILTLKWSDVDFYSNTLTLYTRKRRGGQKQADKLAMTKQLKSIIESRKRKRNKEDVYVFQNPKREIGHYVKEDVRDVMSNLCKKAEVRPFGFHAIRHHVSAILANTGRVSLREIQHYLRHQRPTTTDTYLRGLTPDMDNITNVLDELGKLSQEIADDNNQTIT